RHAPTSPDSKPPARPASSTSRTALRPRRPSLAALTPRPPTVWPPRPAPAHPPSTAHTRGTMTSHAQPTPTDQAPDTEYALLVPGLITVYVTAPTEAAAREALALETADTSELHDLTVGRLAITALDLVPAAAKLDKVDGTLIDDSLPDARSEEHTSELQSRENLVCR